MTQRVLHYLWMVSVLLALVLSACGVNATGDTKIVSEQEIPPPATTTPIPPPTATPAPDSNETTAETPPPADEAPDSSDPAVVDYDLGFALYMEHCVACHGAQEGTIGPGLSSMSELAATRVEGLSATEYIHTSIIDPGAYIVEGYSARMPTQFAEELSPHEVNSLVKFILEFDPASIMPSSDSTNLPDDTEDTPATTDTLTMRGRLVQGTIDGAPLSSGQKLTLEVWNERQEFFSQHQTTSTENNTFVFENVERAPGNVYVIFTDYDDVLQGALIAAIQGDETDLTQDVVLYDRTTDPSTIAVTWAEMLVNYAPIETFGLEIWLTVELINTGDQIVTREETVGEDEQHISVMLELPPASFGIQLMQAEGSRRLSVDVVDGVPRVLDTMPLYPGQAHTITLAYYLPYEDSAVIDQAFGYPVMNAAVLLPNDTVQLESEQFDDEGEWNYRVTHGGVRVVPLQPDEKIDPDNDFTLVKDHQLHSPTRAEDRLIFSLLGHPTRTLDVIATSPQSENSTFLDSNLLPVALTILGLGVILVAVVLWLRQSSTTSATPDTWHPPNDPLDKTALLRSIATLDDAYADGHIDADSYQERRTILSEMLLPLLGEEDEA